MMRSLLAREMRLAASRCSQVRLCSTRVLPPHKLLPMPALSPTMRSGVLHRWLLEKGACVSNYDLVCEVSTTELLEDADDEIVLEVESHEEGFLAKLLSSPPVCASAQDPLLLNGWGGALLDAWQAAAHSWSCLSRRCVSGLTLQLLKPTLFAGAHRLQPGEASAPDMPIAVICEEEEDIAAFEHFGTRELVPAGHFCWQAYVKSGVEERQCEAGAPESSATVQ